MAMFPSAGLFPGDAVPCTAPDRWPGRLADPLDHPGPILASGQETWTARVALHRIPVISELELPETWRRLPPGPGPALPATAMSAAFGDDATLAPAFESTLLVAVTRLPAGTELSSWQSARLEEQRMSLPHLQVLEHGLLPEASAEAAEHATWQQTLLAIDHSPTTYLVRQRSRIVDGIGVSVTLTTTPEVDAAHGAVLDRILASWRIVRAPEEPSPVLMAQGPTPTVQHLLTELSAMPVAAPVPGFDVALTSTLHQILSQPEGHAAVFVARPGEVVSHELTLSHWWTLRTTSRGEDTTEVAVFPSAGLSAAVLHLAELGRLAPLPADLRIPLDHEGLDLIWDWSAEERSTGWAQLRASAADALPGGASASAEDCAIRVTRHTPTGTVTAQVVRLQDRYLISTSPDARVGDAAVLRAADGPLLLADAGCDDALFGSDPSGAARHLVSPLLA
ncbi:hypothetical protein [Brachybacterium hainanense]|uniref:Uncharacterized protein n=1 Tax=Brachybacterium hainanense TaxID=1541174 RepID=A0ABV6RAL0_9MICO